MAKTMMNKPHLIEVLRRDGVVLQPKGRVLWGRCPLHEDKTPSFKVDPERQTFHCFGCGAGGDVISFVQARRKVSFTEALGILGIRSGRTTRPDPDKSKKRELVKAFRLWCRDHAIALARDLRALRGIVSGIRTPEDLELRAWTYDEIPVIEYKLDVLQYGNDEAKYHCKKAATNGSTF
ncbi:MAG TPA: CHC2 zinc finger domain-containing protein [Syntrophales bacterium]|nr:CHC2 zinc finger domain-containing protein [Syntrophales bacterium]